MVQTNKRTTMRVIKKSRNTKKTRGTRYSKRKHNKKTMGKKRRSNKKMYGGSATSIISSFGTNDGANTLGIVSGQTNYVSPNVYDQPIVSPTIGFV